MFNTKPPIDVIEDMLATNAEFRRVIAEIMFNKMCYTGFSQPFQPVPQPYFNTCFDNFNSMTNAYSQTTKLNDKE